jgi:hypothetical protein
MKLTALFSKSLEENGGFSKIIGKDAQLAAVGYEILAVDSVIMRQIQPIFAQAIFGQK